jgi:diguanylate cyclase (GGDEF)-like protein
MRLFLSWFASLDGKTQLRMRITAFAYIDYFVMVLLLLGYAMAGIISYDVPVKIFTAALLIDVLFLAAIGSGWTKRFHDPSITWPQVIAACSVDLMGIILAPHIAYVFIINLFVPLSYGSLNFSDRMFVLVWLFVVAGIGTLLSVLGSTADVALATPLEKIFFWIAIAVTFGRFLTVNAEVSRVRIRLQGRNKELAAETHKLVDLSSRDELTGLWNRREFMRLLQDESRRAIRSRLNFSVAVIDIDHFKQVNDRFGHLVSDAVLHELGQLMESARRATDSVARYGGDQFTLLLVQAKRSTATVALERTRNRVLQHDWANIAPGLQLTVSAGVAEWQPGETLLQVLNRADVALREAKDAGRNCVRVSAPSELQPAAT